MNSAITVKKDKPLDADNFDGQVATFNMGEVTNVEVEDGYMTIYGEHGRYVMFGPEETDKVLRPNLIGEVDPRKLAHDVLDRLLDRVVVEKNLAQEDFDIMVRFTEVANERKEFILDYRGEIASGELEEMNIVQAMYVDGKKVKESRREYLK